MNNVEALESLRNQMRIRQRQWADGKKVIVGDFTYAWGPIIKSWGEESKLYIGKFCSIAGNVQIFLGGDHRNDWITTYPFAELMPNNYPDIKGSPKSKGDVVIGNDVWIGNDVKIMSGIRIEDGATIAGSAVVTKNVPPYTVVGGVPARYIKNRMNPVDAVNLMILEWWNWPLDKLAEAIPILQAENVDALMEFNERWDREHG